MEPVTHLLTGACLGRAGFNRTTALATLTLTLATEAPDIDFVAYAGGSVTGFAHHRGFTHTLLGVPFVAGLTLAAVYALYRLRKKRETETAPRWKLLYLYAILGGLIHIFQDFTNNYGVRPFAPFHPRWYSWDIVFILDPFMLAALFLGLAAPALAGMVTDEIGATRKQFRGRGGAIAALAFLSLLIFVRHIEHLRAVNAMESVTYHGQDPLRVSAYPMPWSPFTWRGVVETQNSFELLPVNALAGELDPQKQAIVRPKPEDTPATLAAKRSRLGRFYLDWAQYPLVEEKLRPGGNDHLVEFRDLRFMTITDLSRGGSVLSGYVLLDGGLQVLEETMARPPRPD
ncbi:MAG TPA: metal-dependent hydrolase [Terriglobales bacterium]|nr:metal-dependent hydrolase [Terriglobales bacterium]